MDKEIIKRLKLIRDLIVLEELDLVESQINKLKAGKHDAQIDTIIREIEAAAFGNAIQLIELYLSQVSGIQIYEDPELDGLRAEIKHLEQQLVDLEGLKTEIEKQIHGFNIQYHRELGHLIDEILRLRKDRLKKEAEEDQKRQTAYNEAKTDYEDYRKIYEETEKKDIPKIPPEEQKELNNIFRKACKLCHPDLVGDDFEEEATTIFINLKNAYDRNDLTQVKEILNSLGKWEILGSRSKRISDKDKLRSEISRINTKIQKVRQEIDDLKQSEAYQTLSKLDDWDSYFLEMKVKLKHELETLKKTSDE